MRLSVAVLDVVVNTGVKTLVNTLVEILVDTPANTLRASKRALPPKPPYQPKAGLICICLIFVEI